MIASAEKVSQDWVDIYEPSNNKWEEFVYPTETLVRLFKGDYVTGEKLNTTDKSILDVGFGDGNNTIFFTTLGMKVSGVEVHQSICDRASERFKRMNVNVDLHVGNNQHLPFQDNTFDYLVSWNVLHYEGTEEGINAGIKEYCRVLKSGGRLILSSTGPKSRILTNSKTLGNHRYQIGRPGDFRQGQVHFFFDAPNYIEMYFSPHFKELQIGRIQDHLFTDNLDWWLVTGVKE